ncbi:MAG: glycosyltransferase, partial [Acidobacteriota bacterium]|nr:glycosyltransferase [Acidobacteriota bacterium]
MTAEAIAGHVPAPAPPPATAPVNLLILASGLGLGGAETVIRHLAQAIDPQRFNVTIGCVKTLGVVGRELAAAGSDIVCLTDPNRQGVDYFTAFELRRVVRSRRIQVIHTHTTDALADAVVCKLMTPRLKVVHTFHFGNYPHIGDRILWMERIFSKAADRIVAVGEVQRRQIRSVFGFREDRIGMIWNGVLTDAPTSDVSFRARIGAGSRLIIGTVATLTEQKGLRDLMAVAARLRDHADKLCFVIVGDGPLRSELEALRRDQGLEDMVILAGWVPAAASVALPAFDVFFLPSLWEAMSVAILEAMAAGKPIVATRVGENSEILEDGADGLLVNAKDVAGMASALLRLVDDRAFRE